MSSSAEKYEGTDYKELDSANRREALDLERSFIVQAPAGAGKTELLTQRFLGLLSRVENPEEIIAITFTRKAAAEMRNRILSRLTESTSPEPEQDHARQSWRLAQAAMQNDRQRGWGILKNPDRLRITTIDSLCASLVRQMPYMSQFGGTPKVAEKPKIHYEEAARRTLLAVEDRSFNEHFGIDLKAIFRALLVNIQAPSGIRLAHLCRIPKPAWGTV